MRTLFDILADNECRCGADDISQVAHVIGRHFVRPSPINNTGLICVRKESDSFSAVTSKSNDR